MKILKNCLYYILFLMCSFLLMSSFFITPDDEFDIVVVSDSPGGEHGHEDCNAYLKIIKSSLTRMPQSIIVEVLATSEDTISMDTIYVDTTSQEIIINNPIDFFITDTPTDFFITDTPTDFFITDTPTDSLADFFINTVDNTLNRTFPDLFLGHQNICTINCTMKMIYMNDTIKKVFKSEEVVPLHCSQ